MLSPKHFSQVIHVFTGRLRLGQCISLRTLNEICIAKEAGFRLKNLTCSLRPFSLLISTN